MPQGKVHKGYDVCLIVMLHKKFNPKMFNLKVIIFFIYGKI